MDFEIRSVVEGDRAGWLAMWSQYCAFYEVALDNRVTESTWRRIVAKDQPIHALIAVDSNGQPLGICNYVCHPNTWSDQTICYLEDMFVAPEGRQRGIATAFINTLTRIGQEQNWFRLYWITNTDNEAARIVYERVAKQTDHVRYEIPLVQ